MTIAIKALTKEAIITIKLLIEEKNPEYILDKIEQYDIDDDAMELINEAIEGIVFAVKSAAKCVLWWKNEENGEFLE